MQPGHQYLSNLTPLRAAAAIWVVVFHFSEIAAKFVSTERTLLLTKGYLMVDLFFIMSGFIIMHVYRQSFQSGISWNHFRRFIVARFARVYPLHFFTLLILILLVASGGAWNPVDSVAAIPTNLLLLHSFGIHEIFTWNVPSWSISAEWWAYMAFPLLAFFIYRKKGVAIFLLSLLIILAYVAIMIWLPRVNLIDPTHPHPVNLDVTFDYGYLRGLAGFSFGMLVYEAFENGLLKELFQKDITALVIIIGILVSMHFGLNDGIIVILFAVLVYAFSLNQGRLHLICNNRLAQYLGKISYSIYLTQVFAMLPVFMGVKLPGLVYVENFRGPATTSFWIGTGYCLINILIVIGISSLTYYKIEKPCRKFINAKWGKETMPVYA
jgi:peptidoglycan/LPS O-acetylase OafA/YrhL